MCVHNHKINYISVELDLDFDPAPDLVITITPTQLEWPEPSSCCDALLITCHGYILHSTQGFTIK